MADIAALGFAIESKSLADANKELDKMPPAAAKAERAAESLTKTTNDLGKAAEGVTQKVRRNLGQYDVLASKSAVVAKNTGQITTATIAAASALKSSERVIQSHTVATAAASVVAKKAANDNFALVASVGRLTGVYALLATALASIATVFSLRPFISETESLSGATKTLGETWRATFDLGKEGAAPLRTSLEDLTIAIENPAFTGFIQLIGRVLVTALSLAVDAVTLLVNGISFLVDNIKQIALVFAPAMSALNLFAKLIETVFGVDLFAIVKGAVNFIIGSFVAAYGDIKFLWANFPDIMSAAFVGAVNAAIRQINNMVAIAAAGINKVIDLANKIKPGAPIPRADTGGVLSEMANPAAGRLAGAAATRGAQQQQELSRDYLGEAGNYLTNGLGRRRITDTPPPDDDKKGRGGGAASAADPYAKAIESAREYIATKKVETEAVGMAGEAAARMKHEQELLNKVQNDGKTATAAQRVEIANLAQQMAAADAALDKAKFMDDASKKAEEFIATQQIERDTLFMSAEAADAYRIAQTYLNDAKAKGINLQTEDIAKLREYASAQAAAAEKTRQLRDIMEFGKSTVKGFFDDINQGLRDGKGVVETFGTAFMNVLDKISSKLMDMAIDDLFNAAFGGASGGGGSGLFNILGSAISGAFGGIGGGVGAGSGTLFAQGAAFRAGNVIPFAAGGIVNRPILFPMANGAGLMGEAGPEAIMPLRRGPGGRLGVAAHGGGNGQAPATVIRLEVSGDNEWVRVIARDESGKVVATAAPQIEARAVKTANRAVPSMVAQDHRNSGGDYRTRTA